MTVPMYRMEVNGENIQSALREYINALASVCLLAPHKERYNFTDLATSE